MRLKRFGRTNLNVSELCLGTGTFGGQADEATSFAIMDHAWEAGVTFFGIADMYPLDDDVTKRGEKVEVQIYRRGIPQK